MPEKFTKGKNEAEKARFGALICDWLNQMNKPRKWLAVQAGVSSSVITHYLNGRNGPSPETLMRMLDAFRRDWKSFTVEMALDAVGSLGHTWEDIVTLAVQVFAPGELRAFLRWWEAGKPDSFVAMVPSLPLSWVRRELIRPLREGLISVDSSGSPQCRALILHGATGTGKTVLAAALARDQKIRAAFGGRTLWLDAEVIRPEDWVARMVDQLGLELQARESLAHCWKRWAREPGRRLLLVIDDLMAEDRDWDAVLDGIGPLDAVLVTTQDISAARAVVQRWIAPEAMQEVHVAGLTPAEGLTLASQVLGHNLSAGEQVYVRELGTALGWHPEALWLAVIEGDETGQWEGLITEVQQGDLNTQVQRMVERQLERLGPDRRGWLNDLIRMMVTECVFTPYYGSAVWDTTLEAAERRMGLLEKRGLIEQLHRDDRKNQEEPWRRLTPVVFRTLFKRRQRSYWHKLKDTWFRFKLNRRMATPDE